MHSTPALLACASTMILVCGCSVEGGTEEWNRDSVVKAAHTEIRYRTTEIADASKGIPDDAVVRTGCLSWYRIRFSSGAVIDDAVVWTEFRIPFGPEWKSQMPTWSVLRLTRSGNGNWRIAERNGRPTECLWSERPSLREVLTQFYSSPGQPGAAMGVPLPRGSSADASVTAAGISDADWRLIADSVPKIVWRPIGEFVH